MNFIEIWQSVLISNVMIFYNFFKIFRSNMYCKMSQIGAAIQLEAYSAKDQIGPFETMILC